jgi:uncharacterized protein YqjF (DUF2071 family)
MLLPADHDANRPGQIVTTQDVEPGMIDRLAPTHRPDRLAVMRQSWRNLLFLHWRVAPELLRPLVPRELDLDLFEGTAYVGLVPFTMVGVRPIGLPPVRGLSRFHETNVRTYVHTSGRNPGVWFFSLDAANPVAVKLARALFHLPYYHARMFLESERSGLGKSTGEILYAGMRLQPGPARASYLIRARVAGKAQPACPGTLDHFLAERYLLYAKRRGCLFRGQVHHLPYPLQPAQALTIDETLLAAAGIARPDSAPLAHFAAGVDVEVFALERLGPRTSRSAQ